MRLVTLLLSGVPQYVTLRDLSYNLDLLFNTNEIETFKIRDLPNHPQTNKRQIALDFRSGYDAMAAQEKLEGYTYELENGREYTLHAKINKFEEYMCSESMEYEGSHWYGGDWMALTLIRSLAVQDIDREHARLDACKSETEGSPPKISRSTSREPSSYRPAWSRSREFSRRGSHRSRSKDSGYVLPRIGWCDECTKTRELRSQSREQRRSNANSRYRRSSSRDRRSSSRERRGHRYPRYREKRSRSSDKYTNRRLTSRERGVRARSRFKEPLARSRDSRSKEHRSRSKERSSRSRERIRYRRSRSRDKTRRDAHVSKSDWYRRGRRLRSPNRRTNQLAIMPRSPRGESPSEWSVDHLKAGTSTGNTKLMADITNKQVHIKVEKDANTPKEADKKGNKSDNNTNQKNKERKKIDKYNSNLKEAEKSTWRVQALSKDIMILVAIVIDEIMDREKIRITASNKLTLIKILDELVQNRLEPIVVKNNDDKEVLKKYKMKFPMESDSKIIQQLLDEILKLEEKVPEATVTVCPESEKSNGTGDNLDVACGPTKQECTTTNVTVESTDNGPQIKQKPTEEPIIIIDIDSAEKPVPRRPQFVVVIKILIKKLNEVIKKNELSEEIKAAELKNVLRHILRNMLKGQGFVRREEIMRRFREKYPEENDELFVRNAIRDIKGGKYPGLTGHIIEIGAPENDVPDEVVVIEKKYDVVTVSDSDDDHVDIKPIKQSATPQQTPTEQNTEEQTAEENQKKASLDNTIQKLECLNDSDACRKTRKRRKRDRKRKRAGKVEETPANDKNSPIEDSNDKVNINAIEDSYNNLKVTAITILTSLNELIAKLNANETENVPNEIKKEIEVEEEELDESSLKLPDGPRVTAITIMTSEAELLSLGQEERKEVNEIKNENDVFYDAEDNFVNDIERAFDDANFCNIMQIERVNQNSVTEQFRGLNNSDQLSSVNNSAQFSSKTALPETNSRTGQDEEETIESIVKYVASMY